jgi:hypothetical protein
MTTQDQNIQRLRELTRDPVAYCEEQRRQDREAKRKQVEGQKAYAGKIYAEHTSHNKAQRAERDKEERAVLEAQLRRRHLAFGGSVESFESRKAELVAEEMQRRSERSEDGTTAQARKRVARAI